LNSYPALENDVAPVADGSTVPGHATTRLSVIIVNFNSGELVTACVRSLLAYPGDLQVLVSDNGSRDGSIRYLKEEISDDRVQIRQNHENLGFSAGANRVLPEADGDLILFLNPDCLVKTDSLSEMVAFMNANPDVGMSGCLIRNLDGSEQPGCRRRVPTPWRTFVRVFHLGCVIKPSERFQPLYLHQTPLPEEPIDIEAISGAFMLVRRKALAGVGPLDAGYFLHCEDLDWCMRFRKQGWRIVFVPKVTITHAKGACSAARPIRVEWHKHKGMIRFYRKFFREQYPLPLMLLVIAAVWARFIVLTLTLMPRGSRV